MLSNKRSWHRNQQIGEKEGELIKIKSSCFLGSDRKSINVTIKIFSRDDRAKIEDALLLFINHTRKNIAVKQPVRQTFHQTEENPAIFVTAEGGDHELVIIDGAKIQVDAEGEDGIAAMRPKVSW